MIKSKDIPRWIGKLPEADCTDIMILLKSGQLFHREYGWLNYDNKDKNLEVSVAGAGDSQEEFCAVREVLKFPADEIYIVRYRGLGGVGKIATLVNYTASRSFDRKQQSLKLVKQTEAETVLSELEAAKKGNQALAEAEALRKKQEGLVRLFINLSCKHFGVTELQLIDLVKEENLPEIGNILFNKLGLEMFVEAAEITIVAISFSIAVALFSIKALLILLFGYLLFFGYFQYCAIEYFFSTDRWKYCRLYSDLKKRLGFGLGFDCFPKGWWGRWTKQRKFSNYELYFDD